MIEVIIDSIRVSLMSQHRIVVLKDLNGERVLPIWIGPCEADAITIELQEMPPQRPLTHDLLKTIINEMGGRVVHILINELRNDVFYSRIVVEINGQQTEIDARPSDAIALAVRVKVPIFIDENVMDKSGIEPEEDVVIEPMTSAPDITDEEPPRLSAFQDFVNSLNLDDLPSDDDEDK